MTRSPSPSPSPSRSVRHRRGNLLTNIALVLPVLIFYELGVLFTDVVNGADLLTQHLIRWLGIRGFVFVQLGLVVAFAVLITLLRRRQRFDTRQFLPILLESSLYAAAMGTFIVFVMTELMHIDPRVAIDGHALAATAHPLAQRGIFDRLVMSAGAGVHEELLFRAGLMQGLIALITWSGRTSRWAAVVWAIAISSLAFSAAHHLGPLGDPLRLGVFVYRSLAGIIFALIFYFRSFAVAVYTHTLYDVYVLLAL